MGDPVENNLLRGSLGSLNSVLADGRRIGNITQRQK